ncbi:hypothetical protein LINGRAHAP2_LOCUS33657, partial [Linum grandiflorum]
ASYNRLSSRVFQSSSTTTISPPPSAAPSSPPAELNFTVSAADADPVPKTTSEIPPSPPNPGITTGLQMAPLLETATSLTTTAGGGGASAGGKFKMEVGDSREEAEADSSLSLSSIMPCQALRTSRQRGRVVEDFDRTGGGRLLL